MSEIIVSTFTCRYMLIYSSFFIPHSRSAVISLRMVRLDVFLVITRGVVLVNDVCGKELLIHVVIFHLET